MKKNDAKKKTAKAGSSRTGRGPAPTSKSTKKAARPARKTAAARKAPRPTAKKQGLSRPARKPAAAAPVAAKAKKRSASAPPTPAAVKPNVVAAKAPRLIVRGPSAMPIPPASALLEPAAVALSTGLARQYDKLVVDRAAKTIFKALRPLVADEEDGDAETQRNKLTLETAHPRRRPDGGYEVFLRYTAGSGLADPESEAEHQAREWFRKHGGEFANVPVAVDVIVNEERDG